MSESMPVAWTFSPLWVAAIILVAIEEIGLMRLRARSRPERAWVWRRRALCYEAGLVVLCLIESSPLAGLSMEHLSLHMALHVLEMFYVPILLVIGAPWVPALFALPVGLRRRLVGGWQLGRARWLTRRISAMVAAPLFGLILFNATMLAWHLPVVMDWAGRNAWAHTWVMTVSFVGSGYLFWRIILPSHPSPPRGLSVRNPAGRRFRNRDDVGRRGRRSMPRDPAHRPLGAPWPWPRSVACGRDRHEAVATT